MKSLHSGTFLDRADAPSETLPTLAEGLDRPLLMVDIDGVISLFGGALDPRAGAPAGSCLHSIDGTPHLLSSSAAAHLLALAGDYELVWASGWEERANEHLPRLLGLPPALPFLRFERAVGRSHAHWKLAAIERHAAGRALAWVDDCFNEACHEWARARAAPTLLVATDPTLGLTEREAQLLRAWARRDQASAARSASETAAP